MTDTPSLRLTRAELVELTGAHHARKQLAWFTANGIPAVEDVTGRLVVLRAAVEAKLMPQGATRAPRRTEPDLGALRGRKAA